MAKLITTPGPANCAAAWPVKTKMPAPMMAPIPRVIRWNGPSARLSPVSASGFSEICIARSCYRVPSQPIRGALHRTLAWLRFRLPAISNSDRAQLDGFPEILRERRRIPDRLRRLFAGLEHHRRRDSPGYFPEHKAAADLGDMRQAGKLLAVDAVVIVKGVDVDH